MVIGGGEHASANFLPMERIYAIKAYRGGITEPVGMDPRRGMIVLWTRKNHANATGATPSNGAASTYCKLRLMTVG